MTIPLLTWRQVVTAHVLHTSVQYYSYYNIICTCKYMLVHGHGHKVKPTCTYTHTCIQSVVGSKPTRGSSFFLGKVTALGVLCWFALFVYLFDLLASFFPPSHLSLKHVQYIHVQVYTYMYMYLYMNITTTCTACSVYMYRCTRTRTCTCK